MKFDSSSNKNVANDVGAVSFPCPQCADEKIIRSKNSRQIVTKYTCGKCGFEGPN